MKKKFSLTELFNLPLAGSSWKDLEAYKSRFILLLHLQVYSVKMMERLLDKLNHKGNKRIAVINSDDDLISQLHSELTGLTIDREIDPRFPYDFIMIFVKGKAEVEAYAPLALHNLLCDGVLWFCYPKKTSKKFKSDIDRDHGWESLSEAGFHGIRMISIDSDWSALRFRNAKFIKSTSGRIKK